MVVVGSGPAGWATAAACRALGLDTTLVAPDPDAAWPATYAAWLDELDPILAGVDPFAVRYEQVRVVARRPFDVARGYGLLANERLAEGLRARAHGVATVAGRVVGVEHDERGSRVLLASGSPVEATVVVDASGHPAALVRRAPQATLAWQTAEGVVAQVSPSPGPPGSCVLMDWSGGRPDDRPPTFLYALDLGDGTWLLEETALAARPALDRAVLRRRLDERLAALDITVHEVVGVEVVRIAMGDPAPPVQRVVGTGAAGGLVHPATGYSVAASLRTAPRLAAALAAALDRRAVPAAVAAAGWAAVWPSRRRRSRAFERFGLERLLTFDRAGVQAFFQAFFGLAPDDWSGYLSGTLTPTAEAAVMARLFAAAPWSVRRRLVPLGGPRSSG